MNDARQPRPPRKRRGRRRSWPCRPPPGGRSSNGPGASASGSTSLAAAANSGSPSTWRSPARTARTPADHSRPMRGGRARAAGAGELGQGLVEYGLILAGSALVAVVLLVFFGGTMSAVLEVIGEA